MTVFSPSQDNKTSSDESDINEVLSDNPSTPCSGYTEETTSDVHVKKVPMKRTKSTTVNYVKTIPMIMTTMVCLVLRVLRLPP